MSTTTNRDSRRDAIENRSTRLPRSDDTARGHEIRVGLFGALGILVLVAGIPAALVLFVGYPLPRTAPSSDWLTVSVDSTLIINVLACLVWLVWAHFVICLVSESRALRRGRLPGNVPLGGGSQVLARRLVAAALLLAGAATMIPHGSGGSHQTPSLPPRPSSVVAAVTPAQTAQEHQAIDQQTVPARSVTKHYVVHPPEGRHHDTLWDIADRTLGNPLRYKEIYDLNKDRVQSDGRTLQNANLIMPGWQLRLPADASGPGVETVTHTAPTSHTAPVGPASAPAGGSVVAEQQSFTAVGHDAAAPAAGTHVSLDNLAVGGGLLLAGLALAYSARRGPYADVDDASQALSSGGDPRLARLLDQALRALAAGRAAQARELPQPVVAWVSDERIALHFAGGDVTEPPLPWRRGEETAVWTVEPALVEPVDVVAPFPALVPIGTNHGFEVFVDLEQAPGLISIAGDQERAREIVTTVAVQLVTSLWSDGARATLVGFADGERLGTIDPKRLHAVATLDPVLDELERQAESVDELRRRLGIEGVLQGRQSTIGHDDRWQPQLVALSGAPTPDQAGRLQNLIGSGRGNVIAVAVGDSPSARWRFVADAAGTVDLGVLGTTAAAHRLTADGVADLLAAMDEADQARRDQTQALTSEAARSRDAVFRARQRVQRLGQARAAVRIRLLGEVRVDAPGPVEETRRSLLTELVVAVAVTDGGLHDAVLRASLWPRGAGEDVVAATIADAQVWLGRSIDGAQRLYQDSNGRWQLGSDVWIDSDEVAELALALDGSSLDAVLGALDLVEGEVFSGTEPGRYGWLAFVRSAREARLALTLVARRAAQLLAAAGRRAEAVVALRRGLTAVPTSELLWRDLLALLGTDGPDAVSAVADEMYLALGDHARWAEPETDALVARLAPGYAYGGPATA